MNIDEPTSLRAEVLARLLLVQSTAAHLPDEAAIVAFTCRGLEMVPGVRRAWSQSDPPPAEPLSPNLVGFELRFGGTEFGAVCLELYCPNEFATYSPHVQNLLFVVALMLEERRQRRMMEEHQRQLELRIQERTRQLSEEKERLQVTLNSIGDGVITTNAHGNVVEMNPIAQELTGWSLEEARGRPLEEVFVLADERQFRTSLAPGARTQPPSTLEYADSSQLMARHGKRYAVSTSRSTMTDRDGTPLGTVLVFHDMTERLRLIEQTQRAERLDAIGILAGGIAHDFNNLLSGIFGYLGLARELATDNEQAAALDEATGVFERARELTRQLLTFSKGGSPVRSAIDLRKLLTDCSRFALSGSNVSLNLRIAPNLTSVAADANQLWRVIDNLIRNAVQAMPQGGAISLEADLVELGKPHHPALTPGQYAKITVKDNGPGIPPEILPRVFDPFFTTKEHGTGLGLATAYSVVRKHEGHIDVASSPEEGTRFDIYLPLAMTNTASVVPPKSLREHNGKGRALVLDDEPYLCTLFTRYLSRMGYRVTAVQSGEEAMAAFDGAIAERDPITVALLDLTIPGGMGGKEVIARIRPRMPSLVAIAASGYSEDPVMAKPADFHFTASLGKPFSIAELATILDTFVK